MVKIYSGFFLVTAIQLLSACVATNVACDIDPSIPTSCDGTDNWFPVSVVGRSTFCAQGPICSVSADGACPGPQANLPYGSRCHLLLEVDQIYGCIPNDFCEQTEPTLQTITKCDVADDTPTVTPAATESQALESNEQGTTTPSTPSPSSDEYTPAATSVPQDEKVEDVTPNLDGESSYQSTEDTKFNSTSDEDATDESSEKSAEDEPCTGSQGFPIAEPDEENTFAETARTESTDDVVESSNDDTTETSNSGFDILPATTSSTGLEKSAEGSAVEQTEDESTEFPIAESAGGSSGHVADEPTEQPGAYDTVGSNVDQPTEDFELSTNVPTEASIEVPADTYSTQPSEALEDPNDYMVSFPIDFDTEDSASNFSADDDDTYHEDLLNVRS